MTSLRERLAPGTWTVDVAATTARFRARDVLRRPVDGNLPVLSAGVEVSPRGAPLHTWAELDLAGVATGNSRRDRDLTGPRFFDVERSRILRFDAESIRAVGAGRWLLLGEIVLKDVRCPLELAAELLTTGDDRAHVRATATLDRWEIGITVPHLLVGREVEIVVEAVVLSPSTTGRL